MHYKLIASWVMDGEADGFALTVHFDGDIDEQVKALEEAAVEDGREHFRVSVIEMTEEQFVQELDLLYPPLG